MKKETKKRSGPAAAVVLAYGLIFIMAMNWLFLWQDGILQNFDNTQIFALSVFTFLVFLAAGITFFISKLLK